MSKPNHLRNVLTGGGPLIAIAVATAMLVGIVAPASAQFFPFGFQQQPPPRPRQNIPQNRAPFGDFFAPFQAEPSYQRPQQQQQQSAPRVDYSRAPPPKSEKGETAPERSILVLGDAMADWLAYGLEDALSEQPDLGVIRKHKTVSGLIKYQPRGEPSDWAVAAKGIVAAEKADAIVVMLGLHDRTSILESAAEKAAGAKKDDKKKSDAKPDDSKTEDAEAAPDDQASDEPSAIAAPERGARSAGNHEFRSERWIELYKKKIDDMIAVLKTKNVPVLWVGLPALRGQKSTSDALFLDALYRESATKAGITYVDIWDGFVDEAGRFLQQGPDFEGQTRRLRTYDGVFFTRAGARKLAHYVDRELQRLMLNRALPVALPSDTGPSMPDVAVQPGAPPPRPLAGPVVPLVAASVSANELLGGSGSRPAAIDSLAARTLVKGEALAAPGGRADDAAWPRREVGKIDTKIDTPVASNANATPEEISAAAANVLAAPLATPKPVVKRRPRPPTVDMTTGGPAANPRPFARQPSYSQPPARPATPRPPAPVGRSAYAPDGFFTR